MPQNLPKLFVGEYESIFKYSILRDLFLVLTHPHSYIIACKGLYAVKHGADEFFDTGFVVGIGGFYLALCDDAADERQAACHAGQ